MRTCTDETVKGGVATANDPSIVTVFVCIAKQQRRQMPLSCPPCSHTELPLKFPDFFLTKFRFFLTNE